MQDNPPLGPTADQYLGPVVVLSLDGLPIFQDPQDLGVTRSSLHQKRNKKDKLTEAASKWKTSSSTALEEGFS